MAKYKEEGMVEAGEVEKEKKRMQHCSCVSIAIKRTRLKGVMRR